MAWLDELPARLRNSLNGLLDAVEQHEDVYLDADNPSVGQIWVAMAQMSEKLDRMEEMVTAQRKALNELGADVDSHLDRNLEESLKRY